MSTSFQYVLRLLLAVPVLSLTSHAGAELSENCTALGEALVEHSCFHSTFGPFVSVPGTPGNKVTSVTPNVDSVHTEYRVGLPIQGDPHLVTYSPQRSGSWIVFTGADVPLDVLDEEGLPLDLLFEQRDETGCDALPVGRVYSLAAKSRYTVKIGPAATTSVMLVIEFADDFLVSVGRDRDGDGFGSRDESFISNCAPPAGFASNTSDCDDTDPEVHPGAVERCDDKDYNCNGSPDDVGLQCRAGSGLCTAVGEFTCDGAFAECNAAPLSPTDETCNGKDDDCDGIIDNPDLPLCTTADQPRCVRQDFGAFCGCLLDGDCGQLNSGRVCDLDTATCVDGCSTDVGGNGCPASQRCESEASPQRGVCVPDEDDEPSAKPEQDTNRRSIVTDPNDGCQCALGLQRTTGTSAPWGMAFGVLSWWLRRRHKRGYDDLVEVHRC